MTPEPTSGNPLRVLSRLRVRDAIIFQSPAVIGLAVYMPDLSIPSLVKALVLTLASFLLTAHIFAFNDWADMALDHENAYKRAQSLKERGFASREVLWMAILLAAAAMVAVIVVSWRLLPIAVGMVLLGILYSFPTSGLKAKGIPVLSSILHFCGIVLTFLLGSTGFAPIDAGALLLGSYFGILIMAGHMVQEVQDYSEDRRAGVRTNAVQFGQAPMFVLSFLLFGLSFAFLVVLAQRNVIPRAVSYTALLFPIYAYWAMRVYRAGLQSSEVRELRNRYRLLFAVVALVLLFAGLARLF